MTDDSQMPAPSLGVAYFSEAGRFNRQTAQQRHHQANDGGALGMRGLAARSHLRAAHAYLLAGKRHRASSETLLGLGATMAQHRTAVAETPEDDQPTHDLPTLAAFVPSLTAISLALIARANETLTELLELFPPEQILATTQRSDLFYGPPFSVVISLALADMTESAITAAAELDTRITPDNYGRQQSLPHLGATLTAILQGDADKANTLFLQALDAHERSRKRGYARNTKRWSYELAILYRLAQRHDIDLEVPDRSHHVELPYMVTLEEFHYQGEHIPFRTKFTHPTDLLPTTFFDAVATAYATTPNDE